MNKLIEEAVVKLNKLIERYRNEIKTFGYTESPVYVSDIANKIDVNFDELMNYFKQHPEYDLSPVSYITKNGISDYILVIR